MDIGWIDLGEMVTGLADIVTRQHDLDAQHVLARDGKAVGPCGPKIHWMQEGVFVDAVIDMCVRREEVADLAQDVRAAYRCFCAQLLLDGAQVQFEPWCVVACHLEMLLLLRPR